jgi:hypothetical protein
MKTDEDVQMISAEVRQRVQSHTVRDYRLPRHPPCSPKHASCSSASSRCVLGVLRPYTSAVPSR